MANKEALNEGKKDAIGMLLGEYDIESAKDIEVLKMIFSHHLIKQTRSFSLFFVRDNGEIKKTCTACDSCCQHDGHKAVLPINKSVK